MWIETSNSGWLENQPDLFNISVFDQELFIGQAVVQIGNRVLGNDSHWKLWNLIENEKAFVKALITSFKLAVMDC